MTESNELCQMKIDPKFGTKATHVGQNPDQWTYKDVVPPISLTTTYKQYGPNNHAVSKYFDLINNYTNSTAKNILSYTPKIVYT